MKHTYCYSIIILLLCMVTSVLSTKSYAQYNPAKGIIFMKETPIDNKNGQDDLLLKEYIFFPIKEQDDEKQAPILNRILGLFGVEIEQGTVVTFDKDTIDAIDKLIPSPNDKIPVSPDETSAFMSTQIVRLEVYNKNGTKLLQTIPMHEEAELIARQKNASGYVDFEDYNFDGFKDISYMLWRTAGPNVPRAYYLYDPNQRKFINNPQLEEIPSLDANPETKTLSSFIRDNACTHYTAHFRFEGTNIVNYRTDWHNYCGDIRPEIGDYVEKNEGEYIPYDPKKHVPCMEDLFSCNRCSC